MFVVLAGGANALAFITPYTVWHVSKTSPNINCSASVTTCQTIGSAVSWASAGDVIMVAPGLYKEQVDIGTPSNLSIFGAQAGKDAREGRYGSDPTVESIVDAGGTKGPHGYGAAFYINVNYTIIDGFTIQGGTSSQGDYTAGIFVNDDKYIHIVNNIIQNNAVGIYAYEMGDGSVIERNLIRNNNNGGLGTHDQPSCCTLAGPGFGLILDEPGDESDANDNAFEGNKATAIFVYDASVTTVSGSTSQNDGALLVITNSIAFHFSHNQGQNFGAKGTLPVMLVSSTPTAADAAIDIAGPDYNEDLQIHGNVLIGGRKTPAGYNGIALSTVFGVIDACDTGCEISGNKISGFPGNGIVAQSVTGTSYGTLDYGAVTNNDVEDNRGVGILIESSFSGSTEYNQYNAIVDNHVEDNHVDDCVDNTVGPDSSYLGTSGTANLWFNDIGQLSRPSGLCGPRMWH